MKNVRKLLFVFLIGMCFYITNVNALVGPIENQDSLIFEHNNKLHVISERNILCDGVNFDDVEIDGYDLEGNFYFEDSENFETYKITKDNTCEIASNEDLFNISNQTRYKLRLEKDNAGNIAINFYERRYEEAYYETTDIEKNINKTYYIYDEENIEMKEYVESTFQNNQKYYEKGYITSPNNIDKDENLTYYKRYGSNVVENAYIVNVLDEYISDEINNYYIVNNNINEPVKSVKVNQEAFQNLDDYYNVSVQNLGDFYLIILTTVDDEEIYKDIEGNIIAKGKDLITAPIGNDLYAIYDETTGKSSIYYKDYNTKIIDVEKFSQIAQTYYSEYYNLGIAMMSDDDKVVTIEHKIYEIINGQNQIYTNSDLEFTFSGELDLFHRILINNEEIEETNYSKSSGSTVINLKSEYLNTLGNGIYTLRIEYKDGGYVETTFKVDKNNIPLSYNLILDANGGKFTDDKTSMDYVFTGIIKDMPTPTRDGYTFKGWYTEKEGGANIASDVNNMEGRTFYAKWEKEEENPKTFDGIGTSIFMGTISLLGLVGATIYLKKEIK